MIRMGQQEIEAVTRVLESGKLFRYGGACDPTEVALLEQEWADKVGTRYALGVTSGTSALICALAGLQIGPGDEVIVPGYTFIATPAAVLAVGAIPVLAEVDDTLCLDPRDIERRISPRTKAIMPVHMQGLPCDMDRIMEIADRHQLFVIEDACQMDGGSYKGRRAGSIGHAGAFSFNYFKLITCGEGGALVTNDQETYLRAQMMHDSGLAFFDPEAAKGSNVPMFLGFNFRLNSILAAIARVQIRQIDGWLDAMRAIKYRMAAELADTGVTIMPCSDPAGDCGLVFGFQFDNEDDALSCRGQLKAAGVAAWRPFDTGRHIYCNWEPILERRAFHCDAMSPYNHPANQGANMDYTPDMLPYTLDILKRTLLITLNPDMDEAEIARITAAIRKATTDVVAAVR